MLTNGWIALLTAKKAIVSSQIIAEIESDSVILSDVCPPNKIAILGHNSIWNRALETNNQLTNYVIRPAKKTLFTQKKKEELKFKINKRRWKRPRKWMKNIFCESSSVSSFVWICDILHSTSPRQHHAMLTSSFYGQIQ